MADRDQGDAEKHPAVRLTALLVLGAGLLALFAGIEWFWMVFALGFAVLVPIVKIVSEGLDDGTDTGRTTADEATSEPDSKQDALDALRARYTRGELSDAEFERKVETLLETETPESARRRIDREPDRLETDDSTR